MAVTQSRVWHPCMKSSLPDTKAPPCNTSVQSSHQVERLYHRVYFCYRKECFQIKFVSKTKEFTSQRLPGRGKDNIPSSALRKLLTQLLGGVKKTESLPDANTGRCQMPSCHSAVRAPHIQAHAESLFCLL